MSHTDQVPAQQSAPMGNPQSPSSRRRYLRHLLWGASGLILLFFVCLIGLYFWVTSSTFENIIRKRLITRIEAATGGRAEIRSFHWKLTDLELDAGGIVLHGRDHRRAVDHVVPRLGARRKRDERQGRQGCARTQAGSAYRELHRMREAKRVRPRRGRCSQNPRFLARHAVRSR